MTGQITIRVSLLVGIFLLTFSSAQADLSQKQARQAITKTVGMALSSSAVRVQSVSSSSKDTGEASAQLELVFRVTRDEGGLWRLRELRTGDARWDDVELVAAAAKFEPDRNACHWKDEYDRYRRESELSVKLARCLVADYFNVSLPSETVRIKSLSPLNFGSQPSALAVALVQADFKLTKDTRGWRVVELRTGNRGWVNVDGVASGIDALKNSRTIEDLNLIASALERHRRERGSFIVSDKYSVVIDNLNPRFLNRVIRLDQWQRPLRYQGTQDHFTLRSLGPDGKENTPDDIVVTR